MAQTLSPPAAGRRERKKRETRSHIRRAALDLALERGVDHVTVEEITERADVSVRTFFNYFDCKEDALLEDLSESAAQLAADVVARPSGESPWQALRAALQASELLHADHCARERVLARQRLVRDNPTLLPRQLAQYAAVEARLIEATAQRLGVDPDVDLRPALLAALALCAVRVAMQRWAADGSRTPSKLVADAFAHVPGGTS
jgi:AcrR family transcriptional regulator